MIINNDTTNKLPGMIISSIYNNSVAFSDFLNKKIIMRVNNIFLSNIERFFTSIESIKGFFSTKILKIKKSFSNYFFETSKAHINGIYKKRQGQTEEELKILPNFKKIKRLNESESILALEKISELSLDETKKLWAAWRI